MSTVDFHFYIVIFFFLLLCLTFMESTLLNYANPCRNWTFQRFASVAEKIERSGTNYKSDNRLDSNPGPRLVAPTLYRLSYGVSRQIRNINPYKLLNLQFISPLYYKKRHKKLNYYIFIYSFTSNQTDTPLADRSLIGYTTLL